MGQGIKGVQGAVDRITFEILQALEERPTTVVWLFDQSGSLHRQRQMIRDRFERIYEELGVAVELRSENRGVQQTANEIPILTSIIGFGSNVTLYTEDPIHEIKEIREVVDSIQVDSSGVERVFTAVESAVNQFKSLRRRRGPNGPMRNVLFVVVTDERGDDPDKLEDAVRACRKWGIPVHTIGVPAPFGREHTFVKYVDPDPKFDQTPQWAEVDQGPESFWPERVQVGFSGNFAQEPVIDSGFGPYALTRLCYETGGIYFAVHPNRNVARRVRGNEIEQYAAKIDYFFDPSVMAKYRPDYVAPKGLRRPGTTESASNRFGQCRSHAANRWDLDAANPVRQTRRSWPGRRAHQRATRRGQARANAPTVAAGPRTRDGVTGDRNEPTLARRLSPCDGDACWLRRLERRPTMPCWPKRNAAWHSPTQKTTPGC